MPPIGLMCRILETNDETWVRPLERAVVQECSYAPETTEFWRYTQGRERALPRALSTIVCKSVARLWCRSTMPAAHVLTKLGQLYSRNLSSIIAICRKSTTNLTSGRGRFHDQGGRGSVFNSQNHRSL